MRRRVIYAAVCAAAAAVLGGAIYGITSSGLGTGASNESSGAKRADTATVGSSVGEQVHRLLSASGSTQPRGEAPVAPDRARTPMLSGPDASPTGISGQAAATVPSCVVKATQRPQAPIAVQRELFQGVDSYLLVLPHPADTTRVDAFVVKASCTGSTSGTVLYRATYSR